jgi:hypothetical protein
MKALLTTVQEIIGLFVEDGSLAVGILVWIGAAALLLPRLPKDAPWSGPLLFLGLALLLLENVRRSARK